MKLTATIAVILFLFIGMFYYLPKRVCDLLGIQRRFWIYAGNALLLIATTSTIGLVSTFSSQWIDLAYLILMALVGFLFYVFLLLLIYEVVKYFIKVPGKKVLATVLILASSVSTYGIWNAYQFHTTEQVIEITGLEKPLRVAVMADVQLGGHRGKAYMEQVVEATNAMQADIILIPGDLADSNAILEEKNFASLAHLNAPSYFILGNHDLYIDTDRLLKILRKNNINILVDDVIETHGISILGLNYMKADNNGFDMHASTETETIQSMLTQLSLPKNKPLLVMHHSPVGAEYVQQAGGALYVAGHTHAGGQVFPVTIVSKLFFEYLSGVYNHSGMPVFVSPGVGTFNLPMRIGTDNELNLLLLKPEGGKYEQKTKNTLRRG